MWTHKIGMLERWDRLSQKAYPLVLCIYISHSNIELTTHATLETKSNVRYMYSGLGKEIDSLVHLHNNN